MRANSFLLLLFFICISFSTSRSKDVELSGLARDFWPCEALDYCGQRTDSENVNCNPANCHPDFQFKTGTEKGITTTVLGEDGKPVFNPQYNGNTVNNAASFNSWFRDTEKSYPISLQLLLKPEGNTWVYDNDKFWPLANVGFGNWPFNTFEKSKWDWEDPDWQYNFHFTLEIHSEFTYYGGETFTFRGDDDLWVYIDGVRVIDLGGVHGPETSTIELNKLGSFGLNLVLNQTYSIDIFFAERHTTQSNFRIQTTIGITCPYEDHCGVCKGEGDSCCQCNDQNPCTDDSCTRDGECVFEEKDCSSKTIDECNVGVCNDAGTCETQAVTCTQPSNKCKRSECTIGIGCQTFDISCNDGNPCTTDTCNPNTGCVNEYACTDGLTCTTNACGANGCSVQNVNCDDNNACTTEQCVEPAGCTYQDISDTCDDGKLCTIDSCLPESGCLNKPRDCDDNNLCTSDQCNENDGECINTYLCDDNNECTKDSCDPTIGCINEAITCEYENLCFDATCDSAIGCVYTPVVCEDNNACTENLCINETGCSYADIPCSAPDACHVASCDPVDGCLITDKDCEDNDLCTINDCNPNSGCSTKAKDCDDDDICTGNYCEPSNGTCMSFEVECNKCLDVTCETVDACFPVRCNPGNGSCVERPVKCDDGNPCTIDTCQNGNCTFTQKTCDQSNPCAPQTCNVDNGECTPKPITCDDRNSCTEDSCVVNGDKAVCENRLRKCDDGKKCTVDSCVRINTTAWTCSNVDRKCNDGNPCTGNSCNEETGQCEYSQKVCSKNNLCDPEFCNRETGECEVRPVTCDDFNLCTSDECKVDLNTNTTVCVFETFCHSNSLCKISSCDRKDGICQETEKDCDDGNACTIDTCEEATGNCKHEQVTCNSTFCAPFSCNSDSGLCEALTPVNCDDGNACSVDTCDNDAQKCVYTKKECENDDICSIASCDTSVGCVFVPRVCDDGNPCTRDLCNSTVGCFSEIIPVKPSSNKCRKRECRPGVGIIEFDINCGFGCGCDEGAGCLPCARGAGPLSTEEATALGAGVFLIVGLSVVGAAVLVVGGKKGFDAYQRKNLFTGSIMNNPTYAAGESTFDNPMFEEEEGTELA